MRALLATLLAALTLAAPFTSHAQHRAGGMSPIIASMGPRGVEIARLHSGSYVLAAPVILGGFSSSGGGSVLSSGMPDPYTPVDGTWNVTGGINASGSVVAGGEVSVGSGSWVTTNGGDRGIWNNGGTTRVLALRGSVADGASAVAVRIEATSDLTTAGAKIASFGDNAGVTYAEKAYVDFAGAIVASAGVTAGVSGDFTVNGSGRGIIGFTGARQIAFGTSGQLTLAPVATYGLTLATTGSKEACVAGIRGTFFYQAGAGGVADTIFVCTKSAADAYAWRDIAAPTP